MQCLKCGTVLPEDTAYCHNCGARLEQASSSATTMSESPTAQAGDWQQNTLVPPPAPASPPQLMAVETPEPPLSSVDELYGATGWAEFSGIQPALDSGSGYPSVSPEPDGYAFPNTYPMPGSLPPGFLPPPAPVPKRRGPLAAIMIILVLLLIGGAVFVGINIGQSHNKTATAQAATTSTASPALNPTQLYQQVTSQNPEFVDSLQNAGTSQWTVFEKPTYGCEIQSDGLHAHIKDTDRYTYCTSGHGKFSNFGFQVDMKMLSGDGGGITFRGDTLAGNLYYFHVYPDGNYHIYTIQNHQLGTELGSGTISTFSSGFGQTNVLTVIARGNQLYFYANQKVITQVQDSTYTNGYVGVLVDDHTAPAEVVYTNAKIWVL